VSLRRDLTLFFIAAAAFGFGDAVLASIFNNFLDTHFQIDGLRRTLLEIPRELPGLLVAFVSAMLAFLPSRRMAALSGFLGFAGLMLLAFLSNTFYMMMPWLFLYSLGQHLFMPLNQAIGMELAEKGQAGRRLGQVSALRNASGIAGSGIVFLGFQFLSLSYTAAMVIGAISMLVAMFCFLKMVPDKPHPQEAHLRLHKEYRLYYLLAVLFGLRKQIFLTFAPWVLVTVFNQPTTMIAKLLTVGGLVGIVIQPMVGRMIDQRGERFTLSVESVLLAFVCAGYALARNLFSADTAFIVVAVCFLLDQTLMSFNIARSTYMKKIAMDSSHVTPTLTMAVSLDHVFSISVAVLGGVLWRHFGYQSVFVAGLGVTIVNWIVAQRMRGHAAPATARP
jgi:predicted MFS family arabinose efflux permease